MKKFFDRSSWMFFTAILSAFLAVSSPDQTLGQSGDWEKEWEMTIQAGKKEAKLVFHSGNSTEAYFREFRKKFPEIKMNRMLTLGAPGRTEKNTKRRG